MVETPSKMMPLGTEAPEFELPDTVSGNMISLQSVRGDKGTLVMFICNHCPFVKHLETPVAQLGRDYQESGISIVAISANDVENYPADHPDRMKANAHAKGYTFPYLYDETQAVAKAYGAACTPDFFLFDADLFCVYRGQFDDSRPGNAVAVTGKDLRTAMDCLRSGKPIPQDQKPSVGCNIKWK